MTCINFYDVNAVVHIEVNVDILQCLRGVMVKRL